MTSVTRTVIVACYLCGEQGGRAQGPADYERLSEEADQAARDAGFRDLPRKGHRPPMSLCPRCVTDVAALQERTW